MTAPPPCPECDDPMTETWRAVPDANYPEREAVRAACAHCGGQWQFYRRPPAFADWIVSAVIVHPGIGVRNGEQT